MCKRISNKVCFIVLGGSGLSRVTELSRVTVIKSCGKHCVIIADSSKMEKKKNVLSEDNTH